MEQCDYWGEGEKRKAASRGGGNGERKKASVDMGCNKGGGVGRETASKVHSRGFKEWHGQI